MIFRNVSASRSASCVLSAVRVYKANAHLVDWGPERSKGYRFKLKMPNFNSRIIAKRWLTEDVVTTLMLIIFTCSVSYFGCTRSIAFNVHSGISHDRGLMIGLSFGVEIGVVPGTGCVFREKILRLPEHEHQDYFHYLHLNKDCFIVKVTTIQAS